jgi:hypothetical protein
LLKYLNIFELALAMVLDGASWQDVEAVVLHDKQQSGLVDAAIVTTSGNQLEIFV